MSRRDRRGKSTTKTPAFVYLMVSHPPIYKIGMSEKPKQRLETVAWEFKVPVSLFHTIWTNRPLFLEEVLHNTFRDKSLGREWFRLDDRDVELICTIEEYIWEYPRPYEECPLPSWVYDGPPCLL